jgi:hypothetical protein
MKTIISMMALLISLNAGGLMGFKLGDYATNVDKILTGRGAVKKEQPVDGVYLYEIDTFAGLDCDNIFLLHNDKDQVIKAMVMTEDKYKTDIFSYYTTLKNALTKKYGSPHKDKYFYLSPYSEGDGYTHQAFRLKKGFKYTQYKTGDMDVYIELNARILDKFCLKISYEDKLLMDAFSKKRKEVNSEDL